MQIFGIKDVQTDTFGLPLCRVTQGVAIREISNGMLQDENLTLNARDFSLYKLGDYDEQSGRLTPCDPKHIVDFTELLPSKE